MLDCRISRLTGMVVYPAIDTTFLRGGAALQLQVLGTYDGGMTRDITRLATFNSSNDNIVTVSANGVVSTSSPRTLTKVTVTITTESFQQSLTIEVSPAVRKMRN